jgi:hypothetical protein
MKKKINKIFALCGLALLLLLGACSEEEVMQPASREIVFTATMPGDDTSALQPGTLKSVVTVSSNDESLNLVAKWKEDDKIQIYVRQEGKVYKVEQLCSIYDIGSNGKTCSFMFSLPSAVDAEKDYDVIGVTGVSTTYISGSDVIAVSQLKRTAVEANGEVASPLWFVTTKSASSAGLQAQFQHLGTYEVLHVKNKSKSSMTFRHRGFEVTNHWYKSSDNTVLSTSYTPSVSSATGDAESDKIITIAAGGSGRVLSWYIPSGAKITDAKLKATVNGKSVTTADTKTSSATIERGKAYHMYVTWDGNDLRFNERDSCPDNNHPHAIDLGLPSGTKWACCNIGANSPTEYGNYYAWGETQPKSVYNWDTYKWGYYDGNGNARISKYNTYSGYGTVDNKTELDLADDAAYVNWGSGWRMPSQTQLQELINNCTSEWTTRNGVNGRLFTSNINGASVFLPAAGYRWYGELDNAGSYGLYWSRTLDSSNPGYAYNLYFDSGSVYWYYKWNYRSNGQSVRAVRVSQN